jgi:hypothetical protein
MVRLSVLAAAALCAIRSLAVGLLALSLAGIAACDSESADESPNSTDVPLYQRLERVEVGMTWDETMKALALAPNALSVPAEGTCRWEDSGGVAIITFENDRVVSKFWTGWP